MTKSVGLTSSIFYKFVSGGGGRLFMTFAVFLSGFLFLISLTLREENSKTVEANSHPSQPSQASLHYQGISPIVLHMDDFMNEDYTKASIPENIKTLIPSVTVTSSEININGIKTFYREALPPKSVQQSGQSVLLLHGAAFKSETWLNLNTIHLLAAMGHRVIAVDLPGFGETKDRLSGDTVSYLENLISTLNLKKIVIISPSMSGSYSIPFVIKKWKSISGYVPVAPVSTGSITDVASNIMLPTLIIYGELDTGLGQRSLSDLKKLPLSKAFVLPHAKHPAYLDQPEMFHSLLYRFMQYLLAKEAK